MGLWGSRRWRGKNWRRSQSRHGADLNLAVRLGAVPYNVQRHDCRGIIAATVAQVHAIAPATTKPAGTTMCRKPGCFCARCPPAGRRC